MIVDTGEEIDGIQIDRSAVRLGEEADAWITIITLATGQYDVANRIYAELDSAIAHAKQCHPDLSPIVKALRLV